MRKLKFYSVKRDRKSRKIEAVLRDGFTDGFFGYYYNEQTLLWYAVDFESGLGVKIAYDKENVIIFECEREVINQCIFERRDGELYQLSKKAVEEARDVWREKLIALIQEAVGSCAYYWAARIADHLAEHGVYVEEVEQ